MSQAIKCDRCGKYYEQGDPMRYLSRHVESSRAGSKKSPVSHIDLCDECDDAFNRWMQFGKDLGKPVDEPPKITHGVNCEKAEHILPFERGHAYDNDGAFVVKGDAYCGRCHQMMTPHEYETRNRSIG
jgi:hypothetical protein